MLPDPHEHERQGSRAVEQLATTRKPRDLKPNLPEAKRPSPRVPNPPA